VVLEEGTYNNEVQLQAPFTHDGKEYNLVVSNRGFAETLAAQPGETWVACPGNSPNGHIVFCRLDRMLKTQDGKHPAEAVIERHVANGFSVTLTAYLRFNYGRSREKVWKKIARLTDFACDDSTVLISTIEAVIEDKESDTGYSPAEDFVIEMPAEAQWRNLDPDDEYKHPECVFRFGEHEFEFTLWDDKLHDRSWYLESEESETEPVYREPDRELEEERYWDRLENDC
jgi:hypothetical protein